MKKENKLTFSEDFLRLFIALQPIGWIEIAPEKTENTTEYNKISKIIERNSQDWFMDYIMDSINDSQKFNSKPLEQILSNILLFTGSSSTRPFPFAETRESVRFGCSRSRLLFYPSSLWFFARVSLNLNLIQKPASKHSGSVVSDTDLLQWANVLGFNLAKQTNKNI